MLFFSFDTRNNMEIIYVNWGLHICNNFIWTFCRILVTSLRMQIPVKYGLQFF